MARRVILISLIAAYLLTRLFHLGALPMVSDEGTYITWGVRALHARGLGDYLASLEDGKQPLLAWLMPPFLAAVPDRLLAGRLVSVLCGGATLLLLVRLGRRLYTPVAGWVAGALYVVAPIALVHDRMALYDSLVTTTALLVLWATLAWAEQPSWRRAGLLGVAMGVALLTKLSALFFVALVPAVVLLWRPTALRRWWPLGHAYFLAGAIYSVLYLSPIVDNIQDGNFQRYSLTAGEVLRLPWALWAKNATFVYEAATTYLGLPLVALLAAATAWGALRGGRSDRVALVWAGVPLLCFVLTAKLIYSRYLVFCFVVALLPAAQALVALAGRWGAASARTTFMPRWAGAAPAGLVAVVIAATTLPFDVQLLADPVAAPWMNDSRYITDRFQYVESNYAGYGLPELVAYVRRQAAEQPVIALSRDVTGMPRDGMTAYLLDWPNVHVGFVRENESIGDRLLRQQDDLFQLAAQGARVYYFLSDAPNGEQEQRFRARHPGLAPLMALPKPGNHSRFQLYETRWPAESDFVLFYPPPRLGSAIELRGFRLSATTVRPGERLRLTLLWQARERVDADYTVFNHLAEPRGRIWGQQDGQPAQGQRPTGRWAPGETIADTYEIPVQPDTPPGPYELLTGMYRLQTMERLPVSGGVEGAAPGDRVRLATITITS